MRSLATKQSSTETTVTHKQATSISSVATKPRSLPTLSTDFPQLQRQCACGGGCPRCQSEALLQPKLKISEPGDQYEQEADRIADQVMRMPEPSVQRQGEPEEEEETVQRQAIANQITPLVQRQVSLEIEEDVIQTKTIDNQTTPSASTQESSEVPSIVDEVLSSPGQTLDPVTRVFMEQRFGYDFSRVRVHSGPAAERSAQDANANAYTVGHNIVFGASRFAPATHEGRRLIAHELTHVLQQADGLQDGDWQLKICSQDDATALTIDHGIQTNISERSIPAQIQRQQLEEDDPIHRPIIESFRREQGLPFGGVDESGQLVVPSEGEIKYQLAPAAQATQVARTIIEAAKDQTKSIQQRAIEAVNNIVENYYDSSLVSEVVYKEKEPGLGTTYVGQGQNIKGKITVGKYFIETLEKFFARKVLQVGHELQHIQQQRQGMSGEANKHKREFLAFAWEALARTRLGTGNVPHATRRDLIDEALKHYYCLKSDEQQLYADKKEALLKQRKIENMAGGNQPKEPPKECEK